MLSTPETHTMAASEFAGRQPLPAELHAATRSEHAILNRTIVARLPLCLPNMSSNPTLYTQGMVVIGQIYYGIEEAWNILLARNDLTQNQKDILNQLNIPQLRRAQRLTLSIQQLEANLTPQSIAHISRIRSATLHFRQDIVQAILAEPHLLMAYTWTMYLALFNGGRWIAKQLLSAGSHFWSEERMAAVRGSLSFWFFGDDEDYEGEDLKLAFKDTFNKVAEKLTDQERDEIIVESKNIFKIFTDMVDFLDQNVQIDTFDQEVPLSRAHDSSRSTQSSISTLEYLASFTPTAIISLWRSITNNISSAQYLRNVPLRQEIEQQNR